MLGLFMCCFLSEVEESEWDSWAFGLLELRSKGTSLKLFFLRNLTLLFSRVFYDCNSLLQINCFLAYFEPLFDFCFFDLEGAGNSSYNIYYFAYSAFYSIIFADFLDSAFLTFETSLVSFIFLGELGIFLSSDTLLLVTAPTDSVVILSSIFLIKAWQLALKVMTLFSLKNLKSRGNSGKVIFLCIFNLVLSKSEPGKQMAPQTKRHSCAILKKVLESFIILIRSSSPMFLSISFKKKVLPLWMLSILDRYSIIFTK